jgi:hypothetical protein
MSIILGILLYTKFRKLATLSLSSKETWCPSIRYIELWLIYGIELICPQEQVTRFRKGKGKVHPKTGH